ncbi:MAG: cupin domain-containing protein [Mycobacteriales bacterium]
MHRVSPHTDDLSQVLSAVQVRSTVFCRSEFRAPWGFRVKDSAYAKFHLVLDGEAELQLEDECEPTRLNSGDVVLLPHGTAHVVKDRPSSRVRGLEQILVDHPVDDEGRMSYGGKGARTTIVCGALNTEPFSDSLLSLLPRLLVVDSASMAMTRWIEPMSQALAEDPVALPGAGVLVAKIADVFLTDVIRQFLAGRRGDVLQAQPIVDASIAEAVALMQAHPGLAWTVGELARRVGMSRTAFAARFRAELGDSPLSYLTKLRLSRGAGHLSTSSRTVREIARLVGYDNEASFSKAFSRLYGQPPGSFRSDRAAQV